MFAHDDVVVSGIGGFFPKAKNITQFKERLYSNEELLSSRWKEGEKGVSNKLGTIDEVDRFDTAFFGIHRHQTTYMDPMQRLILERTFEALADSGTNPQDIRGKKIGVYMASSIGENDNLFYESIVSGFGVTGHSRAMMANRVSYWLNLKGPSCAYDSNWIGGIEVLTLAMNAVREGHCEAAIIGSANLALNAEISWLFNDMGLLSADGSTKAFDVEATGYARSDGIVVMYIQRACDAKRAYASILHSATIFNGARDGPILDQDLDGMINFMEKFYKTCGVNPGDVEYVETYGCAIKRTDEIELKAIESVYCKNRKSPLLIGTLKPQTGHAEASDNLFQIAKVLIALETGQLAAQLQYKTPNPNIPGLLNGKLEVVTENRPWGANLVAVNGMGLCSSYAHVLFKGNPSRNKSLVSTELPKLMVASTRTEAGIQEILTTVQNQKDIDDEFVALTHEFFSKTISGHLYRGYAILDGSESPKQEFEHYPGNKRPIWFIYSGMGSQWVGMASSLMQLPIFANTIMKCHKTLVPKGIDLLKIITDNDPNMFDSILHSFVGIAAVQIALTDVLRALGVVPDGIIGHSVGELGCAYADNCLTAEQMILCAYSRGKASLEVELIKGMMAAIGMGYNNVKDQLPPSIEVACHNSADSCTLSGPTEDMEVYVKELQDKGTFARLVNVSNIAYHSKYIKPAAPRLLEYLQQVIPDAKARSAKWISTSVAEDKWNTDLAKYCSADYHTNNLLSSVLFEEGSKHIPKDAIAIEIAPHGLLQAILKRSLKSGCTNIPLTQRGNKNGMQFLLSAIGKMYLAGVDINIAEIYPPVNYPVSRGTPSLTPLVHWEHSEKWRTGIEDKMNYLVSIKDTQLLLNSDEYRYCNGHELDENCIFPVSAYLDLLIEILLTGVETKPTQIVVENIKFKNMIVMPRAGSVPLHAMIQKGSGTFEIISGEMIVLSGRIYEPDPSEKTRACEIDVPIRENCIELSNEDIYKEFSHRGHKYTGDFNVIKTIQVDETGQKSKVCWNSKWQMLLEGMLQQSILKHGEKYQSVSTPSYIQKIVIAFDKLPETEEIDVTYNYLTEIISTEAMQIVGLQNNNLPQNPKPISYHSINFVPMTKLPCENIETALNYSIHTVINNFNDLDNKTIIVIDVETPESFSENIKNVFDKNIEICGNVSKAMENKIAILSLNSPALVVSSETATENIIKTVSTTHAFAFVRDSSIINNPNIVKVSEFEINGVVYVLIRKAMNQMPNILKIKADAISCKDLAKDSLTWVVELKQMCSTGKLVYLMIPVVPTEGINNFTYALRGMPDFTNVRCLFSLDKKMDFDLNSSIGKEIIRKNLYAVALKNYVLGTYLPLPIDFMSDVKNKELSANTTIIRKNLEYIGVNVNDETLTEEDHDVGLGNIDYAGINKNGERVMGLAKMDADTFDLVPDQILNWKIPETWSMEDGCSIPHAYITAYYCLMIKGKLEPGETVLIHNGCSGIGFASITVALNHGCKVYTTVATEEQRIYIKKNFAKLKDRNILTNKNSTFEAHLLMATGGEGAQLILNTLSKSLLSASVRCTGEFGRFLQLGKFDITENSTIGMSLFLKNTSFGTVIPEEIFDAPVEEKEALRKLLQQGIDQFIVRPIKRVTARHDNVRDILDTLVRYENIGKILVKVTPEVTVNYLNVRKPNQFVCDPNAAYLVYGGSAEHWTDMVEWLVFRGARKILVCSESKPTQVHVTRRLLLLRSYFKAEITYIAKKIQTKENASKLLSDICSIGPIHSVFALPTKHSKCSDLKPIQYIDMALRNVAPKSIFVNLISLASGICQQRIDSGFPSYNIEWAESLEFETGLYGLDEVLTLKTRHIVIKSEKVGDILQETVQDLYKKLIQMLPATTEEMMQQFNEAPKKPTLYQVPTSGPCKIREVPPIFVIPGLFNASHIVDMCSLLFHPTFIARLPNSAMSLEEMAAILAGDIHTIFPRGPYNIVGISWGGLLAIEITKILQKLANTQLTLIDGAPDTIQAAIGHLGNAESIEINILSRLLGITAAEVLRAMNNAQGREERIQLAIQSYEGNKDDVKAIKQAIEVLLYQLNLASRYLPKGDMFAGETYLIRPTGSNKYDSCGLEKYASQSTQIFVVNGDHVSMLQSQQVADAVNEYVAIR